MDISKWNPLTKIKDYRRLMKMTRRPTREEFIQVSKVSALGILVIGLIGFAIFLLMGFVNSII
jgi:protein transport protein SEC61 subunit gamma-like protein